MAIWYISWYTLITLLKVPTFSSDRRLKFIFCVKCRWNILCLCVAQLKFCFQTDLGRQNLASYYRQGRQLPLTFLIMVTRWSRSTFNFYALIGQNLTGEFMRKIFMQHLETCLLWQLKLTEFCVNLWCFLMSFSTGCTKWNTATIKSLLLFMRRLSKSEIRFRMASFSFFTLLDT